MIAWAPHGEILVEEERVETFTERPVHITLTRNAWGLYRWEITVHAESIEGVLQATDKLDTELEERYGSKAPPRFS